MFWTQEVLKGIDSQIPQLINDSKTPSGEPHVGSLRGVLIHDAIYKTLRANGIQARYIFGSDDYDPVDEIPKGQDEHFTQFLGMPLCNTPAPAGSPYTDMADHFISGFFDIFKTLGVEAEHYRMRDVYRSGEFNEAIEKILNNSDAIRNIYREVSGSEKSEAWYPFQSICENCGRIGTTEVIDFDGKEVTYICRPDLVKWAQGCGYKGKRSPFDGQGKLPWKLEWVAKWMTWGITIEGAGMDHSTKGGSRDVSGKVLRTVFGKQPPYNVPYGFFLVDGAKMSSSKGIGSTAREMSEFLSKEMLRFLMLATPPKRAINFSPTENYMVKMYNDFDSLRHAAFDQKSDHDMQQQLFFITEPEVKSDYFLPGFSLVKNLIQLPHIDIFKVAESMKGDALSELEQSRLQSRIDSATYWLDNFADEEERFTIQQTIPADIEAHLSDENLMFIYQFRKGIDDIDWQESALQQHVFDASRLVPVAPKESFRAIYRLLLNKDRGPQVGSLLYYLDKEFVKTRINELAIDADKLRSALTIPFDEFKSYLEKDKDKISKITSKEFASEKGMVIEHTIYLQDGHITTRRSIIEAVDTEAYQVLIKQFS